MKRIFAVLAITTLIVTMLAMPAFAAPVGQEPRCERGQVNATTRGEEKPFENRLKHLVNFIECALDDPPGEGGAI